MKCETCAYWNVHEKAEGFAPCEAAVDPEQARNIGVANVSMQVPTRDALRTRADHGCLAFRPISDVVRARRARDAASVETT